MNESNSLRAMTLITLRRELADVLDIHGAMAPQAFRGAMRRMTNEVLVLLAARANAPLSTLFVFADELAKEFAFQTDAMEGEALRLHLHHVIARSLGRNRPNQSGKTVAASTGMRLLH